MGKPLISICCITYNHEPYIRDCLEGFIMQQTKFPFEVLVHDDASTDHTADIIREYETKYPDIIKPIYQTENQYSKGVKINIDYNFPRVQGKYIALCEGDDFWCDPYKLQIQFDFMESHPDYSACFCGNYILNEFEHRITPMGFPTSELPTDLRDAQRKILLGDHALMTAASLFRTDMFRKIQSVLASDSKGAPMGDLQLFFHLAGMGKIKYIFRRMIVYRRHHGSAMDYCDIQKHKSVLARCNDNIIKMACLNGFDDLKDKIRPRLPTADSLWRRILRKIKRSLRGDYKLYRMYCKQSGRERILHISTFRPE